VNSGNAPATGTVAVQALTTGGTALQSAKVSLAPGQSGFATLFFPKAVVSVVNVETTPLGTILDGPDPY